MHQLDSPQIPSKYLESYGLTRNDKAIIPPNHNMVCSKAASSLSSLVKARVEGDVKQVNGTKGDRGDMWRSAHHHRTLQTFILTTFQKTSLSQISPQANPLLIIPYRLGMRLLCFHCPGIAVIARLPSEWLQLTNNDSQTLHRYT